MFGLSRQVYYRRIRRTKRSQNIASKVVSLVQELRAVQPRIGTRKLYHLLVQELQVLKVGRDKFFDILRANHLLIIPKRSYRTTTMSHHRFKKYPNIIKEMNIYRPNQVWVSDITYIGKREKPCYLSLITDVYSKKIVGFEISSTMCTSHVVKALKMAQKQRKIKESLIHHSDRGIQYCSDEYQYYLNKYKIKCSMTENSDPYENAIAERINGILKQEFMIDTYHLDLTLMKQIVEEAINIYNNDRPHWSNHMLTPNQMHLKSNMNYKTYKTKSSRNLSATTA
ncbi:IS3 family transposase [Sphingobacterium zhuxiongii]|uniref:IS3 family transposase n=1 Tax=Sphingobacterium zhuxiongii TaxID=2662364 RepID=UPI0021D38CBB|nr:IS3 family transposase [Sphingobacterium sp. dk4302]